MNLDTMYCNKKLNFEIIIILIVFFFCCTGSFEIFAQSTQKRTEFSEVFAPSEGMIKSPGKPFREELCLNGKWDFQAVEVLSPGNFQHG